MLHAPAAQDPVIHAVAVRLQLVNLNQQLGQEGATFVKVVRRVSANCGESSGARSLRDGHVIAETALVSACVGGLILAAVSWSASRDMDFKPLASSQSSTVDEPVYDLVVRPDLSGVVTLHRQSRAASRWLKDDMGVDGSDDPWTEARWVGDETVLAVTEDCEDVAVLTSSDEIMIQPINNLGTTRRKAVTVTELGPAASRVVVGKAAFSPDKNYFAALTDSRFSLAVWEVETGMLLWEVTQPEGKNAFDTCIFTPDSRQIVTGVSFSHIGFHDVESGEELNRVTIDSGPIGGISLARDGMTLVYGVLSAEGVVGCIDVASGEKIWEEQHRNGGCRVAEIVCDDQLVAVGGVFGPIIVRQRADGEFVSELDGHQSGVSAIACPAGSTRILSAEYDGPIRAWDLSGFVQE